MNDAITWENTGIACYVSGKGMYATGTTWSFKTSVINSLKSSGLGYDTRFHYYRQQFPEMAQQELARMICDPIEYYDRDWPAYMADQQAGITEIEAVTAFMLERDDQFRAAARVAIFCYDEAGFGSGINTMRFLGNDKPVLGFYNPEWKSATLNLSNILQLRIDYPGLVTLLEYHHPDEITGATTDWLKQLIKQR